MSKQSSIDWLVEQLKPAITLQEKHINEFLQRAKAMHKEEIIAAFKSGLASPYHQDYAIVTQKEEGTKSAQYYKETYGGQDESK